MIREKITQILVGVFMQQIFEEEKPRDGKKFWAYILYCTEPENAFSPAHIHEHVELIYGLTGQYRFTVDGQQYLLNPGDLLIINSWQVHDKQPVADPQGSHILIKLSPDMIYSSYYSLSELRYALPFIFPGMIQNHLVQPNEIRYIFDQLTLELQKKQYGYELVIKSAIYQIVLWIIRNVADKRQELSLYTENTLNNISRAFSYISDHYQEHLSVREIADRCYMDYSYFSKIFKEISQKSCTEYINYFRVQKAETLLLSNSMSITEISSQVGFDNVSYFIKQFRKFKGISPKQYQLNLQKSNLDKKL